MSDVSLRRARPDDEPFLVALYDSTRDDLGPVPPGEWRTQFVLWQYQTRQRAYVEAYPTLEDWIIEQDGRAIGRLTRARTERELRVVDIALVPEARGRGIGTRLLREVQQEAARDGLPVGLSAIADSREEALYVRLGFSRTELTGAYARLTWEAG